MTRSRIALAAAWLVAGLAMPLAAQNLNDLDGDGVPNLQDRCANTPRGVRVDVNGCPVTAGAQPAAQPQGAPGGPAPAGKRARPTPTLVRPGATPANPGATPTAPTNPGAAVVTPQAAVTQSPAAAANAFTAGLAMPPFAGGNDAARLEYVRTLAKNLDSAIVTLVGVFRNTSGQPMPGASAPSSLSARERERWGRCRDLHFDLTTYASGVESILDGLSANPALQRAAAALDTTLTELDSTAECDNVSSMITAPERWDPWAEQYATTARRFYADWYGQVRATQQKDRDLVIALNAVLPPARALQVPSAMPRNPPYAGAAVR
jgi:hypothetical protein